MAVGTSFSNGFSCGEVAVLEGLKVKSGECMKCPPGPEKVALSGSSTELHEELYFADRGFVIIELQSPSLPGRHNMTNDFLVLANTT